MKKKEFNRIYRQNNLTTILFVLSYIFMFLPALAGVMLFMQTILTSWGVWEAHIAFNYYGEWWIEFVFCIGGFITGTILWVIALIRWKNFK